MDNSGSWSSSVVGADGEEPSRANEVGGETRQGAGGGQAYGKVRDHLSRFQKKGKRWLRKREDFWKRLKRRTRKQRPRRSLWDTVHECGDVCKAVLCLERKLSGTVW